MRPSTIWYTLKQGVKNIKRNWMFSLASIITMAACIFLFGIFFSIVNNVNNIEFIVGDVENAFKELVDERKVKPTAIIVDPPRRGLDGTTISKIMELGVKKFVYISCNPATMVRDIKMMENKYEVSEIQPVDMFPFTSHVECVALLSLKN